MLIRLLFIGLLYVLVYQPLQAQSLFSTDIDTTSKILLLPDVQQEETIYLPNWQLRPERYPHLRSPQIKDPATMLLNWQWNIDYLRKRRIDPQAVAWAEMNRQFLEFLERERMANMNPLDRVRLKLGIFRPVFDVVSLLLGMQMNALRGYTFGDQFNLTVAPRSMYSFESMEERFQRNAYKDPETMALYRQFLRMEQSGWTRPAGAEPAILD